MATCVYEGLVNGTCKDDSEKKSEETKKARRVSTNESGRVIQHLIVMTVLYSRHFKKNKLKSFPKYYISEIFLVPRLAKLFAGKIVCKLSTLMVNYT